MTRHSSAAAVRRPKCKSKYLFIFLYYSNPRTVFYLLSFVYPPYNADIYYNYILCIMRMDALGDLSSLFYIVARDYFDISPGIFLASSHIRITTRTHNIRSITVGRHYAIGVRVCVY